MAFLLTHGVVPLAVASLLSAGLMAGGGDFWLADQLYRWQGAQWAWRDAWLTRVVLHQGGRALSLLLLLMVAAACVWAWWRGRRLARAAALRWPLLYLVVAGIAGALVVSVLKSLTNMDCPWSLSRYGGTQPFIGLFESRPPGMARGMCFPAGHASAGYAWVSLYFFAWMVRPAWRVRGLVAGLLAGMLLGATQQVRGAHFLSHDLWTLVICWMIALGSFVLWQRWHPADGLTAGWTAGSAGEPLHDKKKKDQA